MTFSVTTYMADVAPQMECCKATGLLNVGGITPSINIHVPRHVSEATAAAFNRAMRLVPDGDGFKIEAPKGHWWQVTQETAYRTFWHIQSDEVTGDGDPAWMTASARTLDACIDVVDDLVAENQCSECKVMVGEARISDEFGVCDDCSERAAALHEAAEDDRAHAERDLARGL